MPAPDLPTKHTQSGFSLLEILVSIVILSFGVLGVVGLQAASLQVTRESRLHATALRFADEMAEMIRANHQVASKTNPSLNPYMNWGGTVASGTIRCGLPDANTPSCTPIEIARRDVQDWHNRLLKELPGVKAGIYWDTEPYYEGNGRSHWGYTESGNTLSIKIGWTRSNTRTAATAADGSNPNLLNSGAFDKALRPAVVVSVTPGVN